MAVLEYDGIGTGSFMVSQPNGYRHKETVVLADGESLKAGSILGVVTATGEYAHYDKDATDGTENVAGILWSSETTDGAVKQVVAVVRDCEVNGKLLNYGNGVEATVNTELEALGIIVR